MSSSDKDKRIEIGSKLAIELIDNGAKKIIWQNDRYTNTIAGDAGHFSIAYFNKCKQEMDIEFSDRTLRNDKKDIESKVAKKYDKFEFNKSISGKVPRSTSLLSLSLRKHLEQIDIVHKDIANTIHTKKEPMGEVSDVIKDYLSLESGSLIHIFLIFRNYRAAKTTNLSYAVEYITDRISTELYDKKLLYICRGSSNSIELIIKKDDNDTQISDIFTYIKDLFIKED